MSISMIDLLFFASFAQHLITEGFFRMLTTRVCRSYVRGRTHFIFVNGLIW